MSEIRAADHPWRMPHFTRQMSRIEILFSLDIAIRLSFTMVYRNRWKIRDAHASLATGMDMAPLTS